MQDYHAYAVDLMKKLVSVPSISQDEEDVAKLLASVLTELGLDVETERVEGRSWNVYARTKGYGADAGKRLVLGGHIDVVDPGIGWDTEPFVPTEIDGKMYGRGCLDMKGGLACQVAVLKELADAGELDDKSIELVAFCDEERFSIGAYAYVERIRGRGERPADFAVFGEPHFDEIVNGATGKTLFRIETKGRAGHAARPESGTNAVDLMARFLTALEEEWKPRYEAGETASQCVLKIESDYAGYSLNIPDHCVCLLNKQFFVNESEKAYVEHLYRLYDEAVGEGELIVTPDLPHYASCLVQEETEGLALLREVIAESGRKPLLVINQSVSDGNVLAGELGIPTVLYGPKGERLHRENEYVDLMSMDAFRKDMVKFVRRFCG